MAVKERINKLLEQINVGIYEKEEVMALALLSSIAGESIFLLGPPGVAKSLIARQLKYAYKEATTFEYLMSRFSTPDEIFGPVRITKLKNDIYERNVKGYLPDASVVFLDEIWKAGPSIQNALLTILNEKIYRNGDSEINPVPMKALISASNELPAKDQGLEALWDRFLVRLFVEGIKDKGKFDKMITVSSPFNKSATDKAITDDEYKTWTEEIDKIAVPDNVLNIVDVIRKKIELHNNEKNIEEQIYVSDRRWRKVVRLMRASAFLNDRKEVDLMDCFLIKHCIWNEESQIDTAWQFVSEAIEEYGYTVSFDFDVINKELSEFKKEIDEETKFIKDTRKQILESVHNDYYEIIKPPSQNDKLIAKNVFINLTNNNQYMYLYYWHEPYQRIQQHGQFNIRKGNSEFTIFINDIEYNLKKTIQGEKRQTTKKPHQKVEETWDEHVNLLLSNTGNMGTEIESYRNKDLEHLRTNLFVEPALANIVESHIIATKKNIEKLELKIREIQNGYKKLKDEEVILND
jgi:MoxR-like ATPase